MAYEEDEIEPLSKSFKNFLAAVGVTSECRATLWHVDEGPPEYEGLPGYIKFYGSGCDKDLGDPPSTNRDWQLADQFEGWLKANSFKYHRGYPDEPDEKDRRFFLGSDAVKGVLEIAARYGLDEADLDNA